MTTRAQNTARALGGLAFLVTFSGLAAAQAGLGGTPPSLERQLTGPLAVETMPWVDVQDLLAEDAANAADGKIGPYRFGIGHEVGLGLDNAGSWQDLDGGLLWRLRVESPGAHSLNLIFDRYELPEGARLYVHTDSGQVLGGFSTEFNQPHGMFGTEPVAGDALTVEYFVPDADDLGQLRIKEVVHAYKNILGTAAQPAGGAGGTKMSGACNININCPLGADWQDEKRASARLLMGGVLCSGSLVNNTANDGSQYFMTANHCFSGSPGSWVFQFNYESPTCNGTSGTLQSVSGSVLRSRSSTGDNCLVEITQPIPASYNPYFAGWTRSTSPSTHSIGIHHPQGDIKKICEDTNSAISATFGGTPCWRVASWEQGVTEPGSSGSPLYDQNSRYVGQLYGGQATCSFLFNDYYGKFSTSWNTGLAPWLDPLGTNQLTTDGTYGGPPCGVNIYCTAKLNSIGGTPVISAVNTPSFAAQNFQLSSFNGFIPGTNGIHFWSNSGANNAPFAGGTLCLLPPTTRGPVHVYDSLGGVTVPITIQASDVGNTRWFQFWFRDANHPDGTGTGLTNAAEVVFCP